MENILKKYDYIGEFHSFAVRIVVKEEFVCQDGARTYTGGRMEDGRADTSRIKLGIRLSMAMYMHTPIKRLLCEKAL